MVCVECYYYMLDWRKVACRNVHIRTYIMYVVIMWIKVYV